MSTHTEGRIYFKANGEANSYSLINQDTNKWVMAILLNGEQTTARQAANLERMAACWNIAVGTPTQGLQALAAASDTPLASLSRLARELQNPWISVSDRLPAESDGEVLVRMRDGRHEIAWATYWHGASTGFAQWTYRDPDEDDSPTHWMHIPK